MAIDRGVSNDLAKIYDRYKFEEAEPCNITIQDDDDLDRVFNQILKSEKLIYICNSEYPESISIRTNLEAIGILLVQVVCIQKIDFWSLIYSTGGRYVLEYLRHSAKVFQCGRQRSVYVRRLRKNTVNLTVGRLRQQIGLLVEIRYNSFGCFLLGLREHLYPRVFINSHK